jgi:hypothetical protein
MDGLVGCVLVLYKCVKYRIEMKNSETETPTDNLVGVIASQRSQFKTVEILIFGSVGNGFLIFSGPPKHADGHS